VRAGLVVLGILAFFAFVSLRPYTDYLWFSQDAGHPEVFALAYKSRGLLFVLAFALAVGIYAFSFTKALGVTLVYFREPQTMREAVVTQAIGWIQRHGPVVVKIAAVVLAFLAALGFSSEWMTWQLARNGQPFGIEDPTFGRDLGFFVFTLPWLTALANFAFSVSFIGLLVTFGIYFGLEFLATLGRIEVSKPFVRLHLSLLGAAVVISWAARLWLGRYEIGYVDNPLFTGGGFAEQQRLGLQAILALLLVVVAAVLLLNSRVGKPWILSAWAAGIWAGLYAAGMWAYPFIVQKFYVEPNKINVESPFAERAMAMTRYGFGLDRIQERESSAEPLPTAQELAMSRPTLEKMRLWDPGVLRQTIEPIQSLRPYYQFHDVDVDRYVLNGEQRPVMLSPRDIELGGLLPQSRTWVNEKLYYTHGYGVVMAAVNAATAEGRPQFLIRDFPPKTPAELPIEHPQLYFSDLRDELGDTADLVSIVATEAEEFDYPSQEDAVKTRWASPRGVLVGGILPRIAYSVLNGDGNLLISSNITPKSRILYRRNVLERARLVYPFLKFDDDPYIVVHEGRVVWILDGYTATKRLPYSAILGEGGAALNYIRNSVKITLDAYTGEMNAYAMEPDEPLLKAFRKIYPKLVKDRSQVPAALAAHFRYPEDMFLLQAAVLTQYHVKTPNSFLNNDDAWDLPIQRGSAGETSRMDPYYVQIQLPGQKQDRFYLILPMTPRQKGNMAGWLAAGCDPEDYGKVWLYRFPKTSNTPGPSQMDASFNQDREIANLNKLLNSEQSELVQGNLLVVPIGKSVLYVKPLFLRSKTRGVAPIPELKKVILATADNRIVVADTYAQAFARLLGEGATPVQAEPPGGMQPAQPAPEGAEAGSARDKAGIREALELARQADAALRAGDFGKYGELQKRLRQKLEELSR
jgi:uncharacterized membrane protein (UPF0182 family)